MTAGKTAERAERMKHCRKCDTTKPLEEFALRSGVSDGRQPSCKACVKIQNAAYYKATPEKNDARKAGKTLSRIRAMNFVWDHYSSHPCVDCGEPDPVVLEFDHVRGVKSKNISSLIDMGVSLSRIADEIAKCDVRCANCHRRKTAIRGGWYKTISGFERPAPEPLTDTRS
jgi:hypothetical protein